MNELKGRKIEDVADLDVIISFEDKKGYVMTLSPLQMALFVKLFGLQVNEETGDLDFYDDEKLKELFEIGGE